MNINKKCHMCDINLSNVNQNVKYCGTCRKIAIAKDKNKYANKIAKSFDLAELKANFYNLNPQGKHLTHKGFNEISKITYTSYMRQFSMTWIKVIEMFSKKQELLEYVSEQYKMFIVQKQSQDIKIFGKEHPYVTTSLINAVGIDSIRSLADVKNYRLNEDEYKKNFDEVVMNTGSIPLYNEFWELSKISRPSYSRHLGLKGKVYESIVKNYATPSQFEEYLKKQKLHKSGVGKVTGILSAKYDDEDYEREFHKVIDYCKEEFNEFPSTRLFYELTKIDSSCYRNKYKLSWTEICLKYGYKIDRSANKSEKVVLEVVSKILNESYIPQKKFDWLIGTKGFHLYCDGYFPNNSIVVEFDGKQHREPVAVFGGEKAFKTLLANDHIKNTLIPLHNLKLIRISSEEPFWNKQYIKTKLIQQGILLQESMSM